MSPNNQSSKLSSTPTIELSNRLPLYYVQAYKITASKMLLADPELPLAYFGDINKKPVVKNELSGRINEAANKIELDYFFLFRCKPCNF